MALSLNFLIEARVDGGDSSNELITEMTTNWRKHVALNFEAKKAIVAEVNETALSAISSLVADYRGLPVDAMTELRARSREKNVTVRVVKNTLARRAVADTEHACLDEILTGPMVIMFSHEEPGAAARIAKDFMKDNENFEVKGMALGGQLHGAEQLKTIASLPSRDEALAILLNVMQAPITKLVRTMSETYSQAVRVVGAVRDQKQEQ